MSVGQSRDSAGAGSEWAQAWAVCAARLLAPRASPGSSLPKPWASSQDVQTAQTREGVESRGLPTG